MDIIACSLGRTASWTISLLDGDDNPYTFAGTEPLAAKVWSGGTTASLFSPTATWYAPVNGETSQILLTVSATDTAGLAEGTYRLDVDITDTLQDLYDCWLRLTDSSGGTATESPTYCDYADMVGLYEGIDSYESSHQQTQFAQQRGLAREWLDRIILNHDRASSTFYQTAEGYQPINFYGGLGPQVTNPWLKDKLDNNKLMVTSQVRRICAYHALGLILETTIGVDGKESQTAALGRKFLNRANDLICSYVAELDCDDNGIADYYVDCGSNSMRMY